MNTSWDARLAEFLTELSAVQEETLQVLTRRRDLLAASDAEGLAAVGKQEEALIGRLQGCLDQRERLLRQAAREGLPSDNLRALAAAVPGPARAELTERFHSASRRARLLQHQGLVNWIIAQRTLLHLSQILEIMATGGRMQPTYAKGEPATTRGALIDQEV
jgi:flagellar biosynthesis/type III secretory pathway chaperone